MFVPLFESVPLSVSALVRVPASVAIEFGYPFRHFDQDLRLCRTGRTQSCLEPYIAFFADMLLAVVVVSGRPAL